MKHIQKINIFILSVFLVLFMFSCAENYNSEIDLSENEEQREQAFEQILNNEEVFNAFMDRMMEETESMHWMMENQNMMNTMFREDNLDYIMSHNENMHQHMMQNMGDVIYSDTSRMRQWEMMRGDHMGEDGMMH